MECGTASTATGRRAQSPTAVTIHAERGLTPVSSTNTAHVTPSCCSSVSDALPAR
jgi:hypothetical protein